MEVDRRSFRKKAIDHLLAFAAQTVLHGPKYFLNRGTIEGAVNPTDDNKKRGINISRFDR